jgi:thiamine-monophosphate kinase
MKHESRDENSILGLISARTTGSGQILTGRGVSLGIGDDAALFRPKRGYDTILTCDWFLEGTHFLREKHSPDAVGWKCLARALSDVAAMGGIPRCFLLSLALPETYSGRWLDLFLRGLLRASSKFQCVLAGGDTTRQNSILINVTVVGEVRTGRAPLRSGARAGDTLYVSGKLGEAELGLRILRKTRGFTNKINPLIRKHLYPEPRLALGRWLSSRGLASAMMDLSDGLSSDLARLCAASGVGAQVEETRIPRVRASKTTLTHGHDSLQLALHGGDDYELLFTLPARKAKFLPQTFEGVRLTPIGKITRTRDLMVLDENSVAKQLVPGGWDPFSKKL